MFLALLQQCHQVLAHSDLWHIYYNKNTLTASSLACLEIRSRNEEAIKRNSQLKQMRIIYHFLADLHVTRHTSEPESEKRIRNTQNKPCRVELVTSRNHNYRP